MKPSLGHSALYGCRSFWSRAHLRHAKPRARAMLPRIARCDRGRWPCPCRRRQLSSSHAQRSMARSARGGQPEENDTTAERKRPAGRVDPEAVAAGNCLEVSQDGSPASRAVCPSGTVKVRPGTQRAPPGSQDASRHRTQPGGPQLASSHPNLHRHRPKTPSPSQDALGRPRTPRRPGTLYTVPGRSRRSRTLIRAAWDALAIPGRCQPS